MLYALTKLRVNTYQINNIVYGDMLLNNEELHKDRGVRVSLLRVTVETRQQKMPTILT